MRLNISLIDNIKSIFVTERIPERIVRIMAGTDSIHIELLHDKDILNHISFTEDITFVRVHLMSVHSLYKHWLSVHKELSINNFNVSETHLYRS